MYKVFIDTDVILDLLLKRKPFARSAYELFKRIELKELSAYTSPLIIANLHYILSKMLGKTKSLKLIQELLSILRITHIDEKITHRVFQETPPAKDAEDLIQLYSALDTNIEVLVTRNIKDFPQKAGIKVLMPDQFLAMLEKT